MCWRQVSTTSCLPSDPASSGNGIPEAYRSNADAMPVGLHALLEAELTAGNVIVEVSHSHPAPPVGACFMLA